MYNVSIWQAWSLVWGTKPTKPHRGDRTGNSKTLNYRKILEKRKKQLTENENNLKPKYKQSVDWFLNFTCQGWCFAALPSPQSVTPLITPVYSPFKAHTFSARLLFDETLQRSDVFAVVNYPVIL